MNSTRSRRRSDGLISMARCSVADCTQKADARGWCPRHYMRWVRHGDPTHPVGRTGPRKKPPVTYTYLGPHTIEWDPIRWKLWRSESTEPHPHATHLAAGIALFRSMLAAREPQ